LHFTSIICEQHADFRPIANGTQILDLVCQLPRGV